MKFQYSHKLHSSFLLYLNHTLLKKGEAYTNTSSLFYDAPENFNGLFTYALPFAPVVADESITGASIMTGIYVDGVFTQTGQNDLYEINYNKGQIYFTSDQGANILSGDMAIADYNIALTDLDEQAILFETKTFINNRFFNESTGALPVDAITYPAILVRQITHNNRGWALGGTDNEIDSFRCIVLADSAFSLDGVMGVFSEQIREYIPLFEPGEVPFNALGGLRDGSFNYSTLKSTKQAGTQDTVFINDVVTSKFGGNTFTRKLQDEFFKDRVFVGVMDFELHSIRQVP